MTLTTEQLRARAESLGLDFFIERRSGIWVKEWLNDGCTSATDEEVMMWSMLANLEAQPVALVDRRPAASGSICWQNGGKDLAHGTELFTAPPAPANAQSVAWEMRYWNSGHNIWGDWERITAEQHAEMSAEHATDNDYEFRILYDAPPAPQLTNAADWGINMQTGTPILTYKTCCVIESEQAHYVLSLINSAATPAPAYPERLPCPVHLLPGLKFGKGVPTRSMLDALVRRAEYESEREAMTPEQKAEDDARIEAFKALLPRPPAPAVPEKMTAVVKDEAEYANGWNACRAAMLESVAATSSIPMISDSYNLPNGWIACSEQTPVADGAYWCWFGKEKPSVIQQRVCIWNDRNHEWCDSAVTHWMPLPAAPNPEN